MGLVIDCLPTKSNVISPDAAASAAVTDAVETDAAPPSVEVACQEVPSGRPAAGMMALVLTAGQEIVVLKVGLE